MTSGAARTPCCCDWHRVYSTLARSAAAVVVAACWLNNLDQLDLALDRVDLTKVPVYLAGSSGFYSAAALLAALQESKKIEPQARRGAFNADPLGAMAARGMGYRNGDILLAQAAELAVVTARDFPRMTALQVSTMAYDNAGAHTVQELAAAIATGVAYLRACEAAGLPPETAC